MPRQGKTIAQRLAALGFDAKDPDDRVHDLLDAYEKRIEVAAARVLSLEADLTVARDQLRSCENALRKAGA